MILKGEIRCWSLSGIKGSKKGSKSNKKEAEVIKRKKKNNLGIAVNTYSTYTSVCMREHQKCESKGCNFNSENSECFESEYECSDEYIIFHINNCSCNLEHFKTRNQMSIK